MSPGGARGSDLIPVTRASRPCELRKRSMGRRWRPRRAPRTGETPVSQGKSKTGVVGPDQVSTAGRYWSGSSNPAIQAAAWRQVRVSGGTRSRYWRAVEGQRQYR